MINFVESYENVLYGILGFLGLLYLRGYIVATYKLRIGTYIVERETAINDRNIAMSVLIGLSGMICMVYFGARSILPAMDTILSVPNNPNEDVVMITKVPTVTPDVILLLPGQATPVVSKELDIRRRVNTQIPIGGSGCDNKKAIIYSPLPGAVLSGKVEVQGTADIVDFAFYVLEISTLGDNWLTVHTQDIPVSSDILGNWNASFYPQGEYGFRLVVYNAAGAYPVPCVIPIYIGSGP
jgi:hypothetical protein